MIPLTGALDRARKMKDTALLRSGLVGPVSKSEIGNGRYSAEFDVRTADELHRARTAAGEDDALVPFLKRLMPDWCMWDVGAAVGTWTCFAAQHAEEVVAFEPLPANAARLERNVARNGLGECVTVNRHALGDTEGEATLRVDGGAGAGTHRLGEADGTESITVAVARGESILPAPDALKLDVEGHELAVLDGLRGHLGGVEVAVVEVHPEVDVDDVRERLADAGLTVRELELATRTERFLLAERKQ